MPGKKRPRPRLHFKLAAYYRDVIDVGRVGSTLWILRPGGVVITHTTWLSDRVAAAKARWG